MDHIFWRCDFASSGWDLFLQMFDMMYVSQELCSSNRLHSKMEVIKSCGGWIKIKKNLPLPFWKKSVFEAIGKQLGGLLAISSQTLNGLDYSSALIEENLCGFIPAMNIKDINLGVFSIYF